MWAPYITWEACNGHNGDPDSRIGSYLTKVWLSASKRVERIWVGNEGDMSDWSCWGFSSFYETSLISQTIKPIAVEFYFSLTGNKFHPFESKCPKAFTLRDLEIKEWNSMVGPYTYLLSRFYWNGQSYSGDQCLLWWDLVIPSRGSYFL